MVSLPIASNVICSPIWQRMISALIANSSSRFAEIVFLKFLCVAMGMNGETKNINRYTKDIPTGRYNEPETRKIIFQLGKLSK